MCLVTDPWLHVCDSPVERAAPINTWVPGSIICIFAQGMTSQTMVGISEKRLRSSSTSGPVIKRVKVCNSEGGGSQHLSHKSKKTFRKFSWSQISLNSEIGEGSFAKTHKAQVTMDNGYIITAAVKIFET